MILSLVCIAYEAAQCAYCFRKLLSIEAASPCPISWEYLLRVTATPVVLLDTKEIVPFTINEKRVLGLVVSAIVGS